VSDRRIFVRIGKVLLPLLVLGCSAGLAVWFIKTKPAPKKQKHQESSSIVETRVATTATHLITVEAMGVVTPIEDVVLQSEVTGLIVWKHPNLVAGGMVRQGDTLLRVDARNYEAAVKQQQAALEKAKVEYELELSRSEVAAQEWDMMGRGGRGQESGDDKTVGARSQALALREPQLRAAEVAVQAASNALSRSELDVERTHIKAPFNAVVLDEFVDRGQLVSPQTRLAELAGTDAFRIEASLPVRDLQWMTRPDDQGAGGPSATVLHDIGTATPQSFNGVVTRVLSSLDGTARMARILVRVDDPLGLASPGANRRITPLLSGAYVKVLIEGVTVDGVVALPGSVIREGNRLWVMNADSRLEIREAKVIWRQGGRALVKHGVAEGEHVVSSHIPAPIPGMKLRAKGKKPEGGSPGVVPLRGTTPRQVEGGDQKQKSKGSMPGKGKGMKR
jgi:multidrug efflux pump subunit AcrA (membrane-fusion protein)